MLSAHARSIQPDRPPILPVTRVTFLCSAPTAATRRAAFPVDEPLDARGRAAAVSVTNLGRFDRVVSSPARRAVQTVEVLDRTATIDADLRDVDYGRWAGLGIDEVAANEPASLAAWRNDPESAPHGGESVAALFRRAEAFLAKSKDRTGSTLAVTHAAVIRAAIVAVLEAPLAAFWRIEVGPLCIAQIQWEGRFWRFRSLVNPRAAPARRERTREP
jgi:broad specificity phosphatase PhoE